MWNRGISSNSLITASTSSPIKEGIHPEITAKASPFITSDDASIKFLSLSSPPKITCSSTSPVVGVLVPPKGPPAFWPDAYNCPNSCPNPHPNPECRSGTSPKTPNAVPYAPASAQEYLGASMESFP